MCEYYHQTESNEINIRLSETMYAVSRLSALLTPIYGSAVFRRFFRRVLLWDVLSCPVIDFILVRFVK